MSGCIDDIQGVCGGRDGPEERFCGGWQPRSGDHVFIVIRWRPGVTCRIDLLALPPSDRWQQRHEPWRRGS